MPLPVFDAASSGTAFPDPGVTLTVSHIIGANANRILSVLAFVDRDRTITGATYGGVSMTLQASGQPAATWRYALFTLIAPTTGTANIVVTYGGTSARLSLIALSYDTVDQTTPFGTFSTATNNGTKTVTPSAVSGDLLHGMSVGITGGTITVGASETERVNLAPGGEGRLQGSDVPKNTTGDVVRTFQFNDEGVLVGVALKQTSAAGVTYPQLERGIRGLMRGVAQER